MSNNLPPELMAKPLALIGLTGLDMSNTMHRSIWDAFSNNRRPDSLPVQFKLLQPSHEFPSPKPKRNSYEWYIPKGILKRNWMSKYLNEIPSVVVFFYDLDWTDVQWNEKKVECASKVQLLRSSLDGRSTKIAVVLIQRSSSSSSSSSSTSGTEDVQSTERATSLCTSCELQSKLLYILPHGDHLLGYTSRLENAFYDLSQNYYNHEYRIIKNHREQLNKNTHQYLIVRHQYKMSFFNELRQDKIIALRHYQQCYKDLIDIRINDNNTNEIKTISSFINYKICKLMFSLNQPRDAISQFRCHTERYRNNNGGIDDIIFEHHEWMSNQYSTFGELFDDAIRQGLPAVQTQHPGYYYQLAAHHSGLRKSSINNIIERLNIDYKNNLWDKELLDDSKLEYYGQRPWKLNIEKNDGNNKEEYGKIIKSLQLREINNVNHSMIIIGLLGNAISQFKIYRCPRMRKLLVVKMAEEYFNAKDYGKVLTLLMHMLWDYRGERWPILLTDIIKNALKAAYLSTSIQEYLTLGIEALGPSTILNEEHKKIIHNNINCILKRIVPKPEPDLPDDDTIIAIDKWKNELLHIDNFFITIDDTNMSSFIQLKVKFLNNIFIVGDMVKIKIYIRNLYNDIIEFSKISIGITTLGTNNEYYIDEKDDNNFKFKSNELKKFYYEFNTPNQADCSEIQINYISLYLGNEKKFFIIIKFSSFNGDCPTLDRIYPEIQKLRGGYFEKIQSLTVAEIKHEDKSVNINIDAKIPALLSEWMPMKISISSYQNISNVVLQVKQILGENSVDPAVELSLSTELKKINETNQNSITITLDNKNNQDNKMNIIEKIIFIRCHQIGNRNFSINIEYKDNDELKRNKELLYSLTIVKPFDVSTQFYTKLFEPLTKAFVNEPFMIMPHIVCTSPWPLRIINSSIELGNSIDKLNKTNDDDDESLLKDMVIRDGETATDAFCVVPKLSSEQPTSTGVYTIKWQRFYDNNIIETSTSVTLAPLWVEDIVVGLDANIPAHGFVRTPLCVTYFIKNHSNLLFTLRLTMEASDAFMFAGQKQIDICIRPNNKKKIDWILRPLVAGFVALPTLSLTVPTDEEHKVNKIRLAEVMERSLPTHIYIMPKSQSVEA